MKRTSFLFYRPQISVLFSIPLLILLQVYCLSCKKKCPTHTCVAFSDPYFDNWFPYSKGQEILFKNTTGTERKLTIGVVYKSEASTTTIPCGPDAPIVEYLPCPMALIQSSSPTNATIGFNIEYFPSGGLQFILDTSTLYATAIKDTGIVGLRQVSRATFNSSRFYPTYNLNGTTYSNVQVIMRDTATNHTKNIYKIILAERTGVLAYEEYPALDLWVKQ
jgi:hypothetical protein